MWQALYSVPIVKMLAASPLVGKTKGYKPIMIVKKPAFNAFFACRTTCMQEQAHYGEFMFDTLFVLINK